MATFYSVDNPIVQGSVLYYDTTLTQPVANGYYTNNLNTGDVYTVSGTTPFNGITTPGQVVAFAPVACLTNPNCGAPPPPIYYLADKYGCPNTGYGCSNEITTGEVVYVDGSTPLTINKWYAEVGNTAPYGFIYLITGVTTTQTSTIQIDATTVANTCNAICRRVP